MTQKPFKSIRRTVVAVFEDCEVPVTSRVKQWEDAAKYGGRRYHRIEYAGPTADCAGSAYIIDLELECRGANRHDFTKFVRTYLPEVTSYYITD